MSAARNGGALRAIAQLRLKGHPIAAFFVRVAEGTWREALVDQADAAGRVVIVRRDDHRRLGDQGGESVREAGGNVVLVTMIDREEGRTFKAAGIPFRALYKASEF